MTIADAEKKIRIAWISGIISTSLTLILAVAALASQSGEFDVQGTTISGWYLLDVFLGSVLTFGVYRKSRTAAVAMFAFFLISKIIIWANGISATGSAPGVVLGIVFLLIYFEGARGAIAYHRLRSERILPGGQIAASDLSSDVTDQDGTVSR